MKAIYEANIRQVCVESRPHPDFAGPGWWRDMDVILDEAVKRNMRVWILDDQHFPTGYAAGAVEHADPAYCHQYLDYNTLVSWGPKPRMEVDVAAYAKPSPPRPGCRPSPRQNGCFMTTGCFGFWPAGFWKADWKRTRWI